MQWDEAQYSLAPPVPDIRLTYDSTRRPTQVLQAPTSA